MSPVRTSLERDLFPPIQRLLKRAGWRVWGEATLRAGERTRTVDLLGWRWDGDLIDAIAVEVELGDGDRGIPQGVAYGVGFDRVMVAAEKTLPDHVQSVFEKLGLGYIVASSSRAAVVLEPGRNSLVDRQARDENRARVRLRHLWNDRVVGETTRFGKDQRGPLWGTIGPMSEWRIAALLHPHGTHTHLSLVAESTPLGKQVSTSAKPKRFMEVIAPLDGAEIHLRRREYKFQPRYKDVATWSPGDDTAAMRKLLAAARRIKGTSLGPWFEIRTNLWSHSARLTEPQAAQELRAAVDRLRPVRDELNRMVR